MKYRLIFGRAALLILGVPLLGQGTLIVHAATRPFSVALAAGLYGNQHSSTRLPERILIPSIKVDAAVEWLGLTPTGAVATPVGPADAAWFSKGPIPGSKGSAVMVGHYGWKDGVEAAFNNLHELHKGDMVYVEDGSGNKFAFVVTNIHTYNAEEFVPQAFTSDAGSHLNLITCGGTWDASKKSYTKRLVVFTDLVS